MRTVGVYLLLFHFQISVVDDTEICSNLSGCLTMCRLIPRSQYEIGEKFLEMRISCYAWQRPVGAQLILNNQLREQLILRVLILFLSFGLCIKHLGAVCCPAKLITFSSTGEWKLGSCFDVLNMWLALCLSLHSPSSHSSPCFKPLCVVCVSVCMRCRILALSSSLSSWSIRNFTCCNNILLLYF